MNRISRRPAAETAEALLEVGRTEPVLDYDVELGLARHHEWLRSDAPLPEWASASVSSAAKSLVPVAIKTLVSAVLIGALGVGAWYALGGSQPSAAAIHPASPPPEPTQAAAEAHAALGPKPLPVPDHGLPSDLPVRRAVRAKRAHREPASVRAARVAAVPPAETAASVQAAAPASTAPSEDISPAEVAAAPERKPIPEAQKPQPEPATRAQVPEDLLEMQQVAKAEQLLQRSPERALALVRQGDQRFAGGYFRQERAYIATMALIRLGRMDEARARAASFAKQFPALPYGARIRSALEAAAPSAASRGAVP